MKYLADEDFPHASYKVLVAAGFDIQHVGMLYAGQKDIDIVRIAQENDRTLLTFDSDYGTLAFKDGVWPKCGIIYFRMHNYTPEEPATRFLSILQADPNLEWADRVTVISRESVSYTHLTLPTSDLV